VSAANATTEDAGPVGAAAQPAEPRPAEEADLAARLAELEAQLASARAEGDRVRDEWLRAKAETDNVRRRSADEVARANRFGIESFASALLTVKDSLEAALTVENPSVESFKQGVEITSRQLDAAFERFSLREIAPNPGEKFDPHRHQAISQVESDLEPNSVATLLQKGWLLHERVLRPALVSVARPKAAAAPVQAPAEDGEAH
jgi:molecular chaperone GrpE